MILERHRKRLCCHGQFSCNHNIVGGWVKCFLQYLCFSDCHDNTVLFWLIVMAVFVFFLIVMLIWMYAFTVPVLIWECVKCFSIDVGIYCTCAYLRVCECFSIDVCLCSTCASWGGGGGGVLCVFFFFFFIVMFHPGFVSRWYWCMYL